MDDTKESGSVEIITTQPTEPRTRVLKNGAVYNLDTGRIMQGPTVPTINKDNASQLGKRRHEVARAKIAKSIADISRNKTGLAHGPSDAVAYAAGELWHDIVLNKQASDRERRETWQALTKASGYQLSDREMSQDSGNNGISQPESALTNAIYAALMRVRDELSGNSST